jgi:hypothetical protein
VRSHHRNPFALEIYLREIRLASTLTCRNTPVWAKFKKRVGEVNADAHLLDRLEGLSWLEPEKRNVFAQKLKLVALKSRSQIFVTGTSADQAYVVLRGLVQVGEPGSSLTSIVGPGEIFGLSGLVPYAGITRTGRPQNSD